MTIVSTLISREENVLDTTGTTEFLVPDTETMASKEVMLEAMNAVYYLHDDELRILHESHEL